MCLMNKSDLISEHFWMDILTIDKRNDTLILLDDILDVSDQFVSHVRYDIAIH